MRYAKPVKKPYRVLELGPAVRANIPFFKELGVEYYGVEGSSTALKELKKRFPEFSKNIVVGDFTIQIPFDVMFDLIVDRASLTHNTTKAIQQGLALVEKKLASKGLFIGIDWFSTEHSDAARGSKGEDGNTKTDISSGQFAGIGATHFSDKKHIEALFSAFTLLKLEHKVVKEEIPSKGHTFASWNFVAQKKS